MNLQKDVLDGILKNAMEAMCSVRTSEISNYVTAQNNIVGRGTRALYKRQASVKCCP